jgi:hypothetical protein
MLLADGTDTDKVMIRAVSKDCAYPDQIKPASDYTYCMKPLPRTIRAFLEYWNNPITGNDQWIFSLHNSELDIQEKLFTDEIENADFDSNAKYEFSYYV